MSYIYIAGPYSKDDPVINTANAIKAAEILVSHGYTPYIPHLTMFWHFIIPHEIDYWYKYDLEWLDKCDCLLRLPGKSSGADAEVTHAIVKGIPVYYSIEDCIHDNLSSL